MSENRYKAALDDLDEWDNRDLDPDSYLILHETTIRSALKLAQETEQMRKSRGRFATAIWFDEAKRVSEKDWSKTSESKKGDENLKEQREELKAKMESFLEEDITRTKTVDGATVGFIYHDELVEQLREERDEFKELYDVMVERYTDLSKKVAGE